MTTLSLNEIATNPLVIALMSALIAAVVAGPVNHAYTAKRETDKRRDEALTAYLVSAYDKLAQSSNRTPYLPRGDRDLTQVEQLRVAEDAEYMRMFESAIATIQLFGHSDQIRLLHQALDASAGGRRMDLDPLLFSLRRSLREKLHLSDETTNIRWLRVPRLPHENPRQ